MVDLTFQSTSTCIWVLVFCERKFLRLPKVIRQNEWSGILEQVSYFRYTLSNFDLYIIEFSEKKEHVQLRFDVQKLRLFWEQWSKLEQTWQFDEWTRGWLKGGGGGGGVLINSAYGLMPID